MSELHEALTQGLQRLDEVAARLADTRTRAFDTRAHLGGAAARLESRAAALPARATDAVGRLDAEGAAAESACAEAGRELDGASAVVLEQRAALGAEVGQGLAELAELGRELARMHQDLQQREAAASAGLEASARRTREALQAVADDLDGFETWVSRELTPDLHRHRQAVDEGSEALRRRVAESALPALAGAYEETRDHLQALAAQIRTELATQRRDAGEAALAALQGLAECVDRLLARNLEVLAGVRAFFGSERGHLRGRADEFARHAEQHAQIGDPAARGLKGLVDALFRLEALLAEIDLIAAPLR